MFSIVVVVIDPWAKQAEVFYQKEKNHLWGGFYFLLIDLFTSSGKMEPLYHC